VLLATTPETDSHAGKPSAPGLWMVCGLLVNR
jgi:hypothetical protein